MTSPNQIYKVGPLHRPTFFPIQISNLILVPDPQAVATLMQFSRFGVKQKMSLSRQYRYVGRPIRRDKAMITAIARNLPDNSYCSGIILRLYPLELGGGELDAKTRLSKNLSKLITNANFRQLASYCDTNPRTVKRWIEDQRAPELPVLDRIAQFFGIDVAELFEDPEPREISPEMVNAAIRTLAKAHGYKASLTKINPKADDKEDS